MGNNELRADRIKERSKKERFVIIFKDPNRVRVYDQEKGLIPKLRNMILINSVGLVFIRNLDSKSLNVRVVKINCLNKKYKKEYRKNTKHYFHDVIKSNYYF